MSPGQSENSPAAPTAPQELGLVGETAVCSYTNHMLDWLPLADPKILPDPSIRLYWLLKSFIIDDKGRDGTERVVQIVQEDLADMLHRSVDSIQRAFKPLYKLGLVEDQERRKVSVRVPGRKKPVVTTLLILKIHDHEPDADYGGWRRPFAARKDVRARRAAKQAEQKTAGQSGAADLRSQSDQGSCSPNGEQLELPAAPVDNLPEPVPDGVSAGQCDTADLPENTADLRQNAADLRCIGSNPAGSNLSGTNTGASGGLDRPFGPIELNQDQLTSSSGTTDLELVGDQQSARAQIEAAVTELISEAVRRELCEGDVGQADLRPDSPVVTELGRLLTIAGVGATYNASCIEAYRRILNATNGPEFNHDRIEAFRQAYPALNRWEANLELQRRVVRGLVENAARDAAMALQVVTAAQVPA